MNFVAFFTKIKTTTCGPYGAGFHGKLCPGKSAPGVARVEETQVITPAASYFSYPKC